MKGLRVSKLEEGQQWGKNTSSKDEVGWGRRPPFRGAPESNRYVLRLRTSGTTAQGSGTTARAVEHRDQSKTEGEAEPNQQHYRWIQRYYRSPSRYCRWAQSGTTAMVRAVLPHTSGTTAPHNRGQYRKTRPEKGALESRRY